MPVTELDQVLVDSAVEVLETMFFSEAVPAEDTAGAAGEAGVSVQVGFGPDPEGELQATVGWGVAEELAESLLGRPAATLSRGEVLSSVCEMTNMICGAALSRLLGGRAFRLATPVLAAENAPAQGGAGVEIRLQLDSGVLQLAFRPGRSAAQPCLPSEC